MTSQGSWAALRHPAFRIYWLGRTISIYGNLVLITAQAWLVTSLSKNASALGLLHLTTVLPMLVFGLKAGQLADRHEKLRLLVFTQLTMVLLALALAAFVYSGALVFWGLLPLGLMAGLAEAFEMPARESLPAELVNHADISSAVGLVQVAAHSCRLLGPALAGVLIERAGLAAPFLMSAASFFVVIFCIMAARSKHRRQPRPVTAEHPKGLPMREGLAYVRSQPAVRSIIILATLLLGCTFPFTMVLMAFYVRHALGTDDAEVLSLIMTGVGIGSITGAAMVLFGRKESRRAWLSTAVVGVGAGLIGLSVARQLTAVVLFAVLLAFSTTSIAGRLQQMLQEQVPNELRGRVTAIHGMLALGAVPVGVMLWSSLIDALQHAGGYARVLQIAAGLFVVSASWVLWRAWDAFASRAVAPAAVEAAVPQ